MCLLVPESVRVEDPNRRDDGDPGDDEQAREQLQGRPAGQAGFWLARRRGAFAGRRCR
jgi:hypothetical protein